MLTGRCLCGAVRIELHGEPMLVDMCHCTTCRRWTGHALAGVGADRSQVRIEGEEAVRWYRSSDKVRRGFCGTCGSTLFFDPLFHDWISIALGAFDTPTGLQLSRHIFVAEKGDYYAIADGLPQNPQ